MVLVFAVMDKARADVFATVTPGKNHFCLSKCFLSEKWPLIVGNGFTSLHLAKTSDVDLTTSTQCFFWKSTPPASHTNNVHGICQKINCTHKPHNIVQESICKLLPRSVKHSSCFNNDASSRQNRF